MSLSICYGCDGVGRVLRQEGLRRLTSPLMGGALGARQRVTQAGEGYATRTIEPGECGGVGGRLAGDWCRPAGLGVFPLARAGGRVPLQSPRRTELLGQDSPLRCSLSPVEPRRAEFGARWATLSGKQAAGCNSGVLGASTPRCEDAPTCLWRLPGVRVDSLQVAVPALQGPRRTASVGAIPQRATIYLTKRPRPPR
jgi:hypothetical protein